MLQVALAHLAGRAQAERVMGTLICLARKSAIHTATNSTNTVISAISSV